MDRIKVLLICHFSNPEVRSKLSLRKGREFHDFAPWISNWLIAFAQREELEIIVVAPHQGMEQRTQSFEINGITYYFYNAWTDLGKFIQTGFNYVLSRVATRSLAFIIHYVRYMYWSIAFQRQKRFVRRIVRQLAPDIIHLSGSENPYYSSTILGLENEGIPICLNPQGILNLPNASSVDVSRVKIQNSIHRKLRYYFVFTHDFFQHIKLCNPSAIFFLTTGIRTINIDPCVVKAPKEFDFVFMARVIPSKGIEQLLKALSAIHKEYSEASLLVLGPSSKSYQAHLKGICEDYGISNNVVFGGHISRREDLFMEVLKARIYVLPTIYEGMATSAVEAMLLGLPVVTYATGGMPFLNNDGENVLMCETGDIESLKENMIRLLTDPVFAHELALRGQAFAKRTFGEEENLRLRVRQYEAIIEHYHHGTSIPDELIFAGEYFQRT